MSIQEQTKHQGRSRLVTDFVIDPAEFETYFKLSHRVNPCLSRPLYAYRGLAVGAVQAALLDVKLLGMFYSATRSDVVDHLAQEINQFVAQSDRINPEDKEDVTDYVAELVYYLCGAILQRHPELRENPGRYDVTIKPGPQIPGTVACLVFTLELKYNFAGYPQKKLSVEPTPSQYKLGVIESTTITRGAGYEPYDISLNWPYQPEMVSRIDVLQFGQPCPEARVVPRNVRESYVEDTPVGLGEVDPRRDRGYPEDPGSPSSPLATDARRKW